MNTSFERVPNGKDEWLTPPNILQKLGDFDLDVCAPIVRPWEIAKNHFTIEDDGLKKEWKGRVWCNPPYGNEAQKWLMKCAQYGNCTALVFARTETKMFFESVWNQAFALLFIKGRLKFYHVNGKAASSAGSPSVLIAYDAKNADILKKSNIEGKFIQLK